MLIFLILVKKDLKGFLITKQGNQILQTLTKKELIQEVSHIFD